MWSNPVKNLFVAFCQHTSLDRAVHVAALYRHSPRFLWRPELHHQHTIFNWHEAVMRAID